jgi:hypothetical protein
LAELKDGGEGSPNPDIVIADWQVDGAATTADVARMVRSGNPEEHEALPAFFQSK